MDKPDFAKVYADCKDNVWKLVARYAAGREDREDLFQEVFVRIHNAIPRFRGEADINTWVYRITVNTALNHLKKQKRYQWFKNMLGSLRMPEQTAPEADSDLKTFKPLEKLNPQQRMILLLSDIEEMKLEEISSMLKIPLGTVKSTLHRAREIVKKEVIKNEEL